MTDEQLDTCGHREAIEYLSCRSTYYVCAECGEPIDADFVADSEVHIMNRPVSFGGINGH